jgi:two-component system, OmpR family, KDP operon response regulator KdpE
VDDCMQHPVSPKIFLAKVKAWLRRAQVIPIEALDQVEVRSFRLEPARRQLIINKNEGSEGKIIHLTNLEFRLLWLLMNNPNHLFEPDYLINQVWGIYGDGDGTLLKNLVYRLRRKIEPNPSDPRFILNEHGQGYKFVPA